jgi:hypothetical protein
MVRTSAAINEHEEPMALDEPVMDAPPVMGAGRERRISVRAYNYWVSMLAGREFPSVSDLNANDIAGFRDASILLDFSSGPSDPILRYIGKGLREESGLSTSEIKPDQVPGRSLLSRLTAHYLEIMANRAPIGFEAEFINTRGKLTFYRGILLPLSDDGKNINFIYGVMSWKEEAAMADSADARAALERSAMRPIGQVDDIFNLSQPAPLALDTLADDTLDLTPEAQAPTDDEEYLDLDHADDALVLDSGESALELDAAAALAVDAEEPLDLIPDALDLTDFESVSADEEVLDLGVSLQPLSAAIEVDDAAVSRLADRLALARDAAEQIKTADSRTRSALYDALGEALAFYADASADPVSYAILLEDAGLKMQDRAPFTPTVKMIFGVDYDKTRLTEYAAALSYAQREDVQPAAFRDYLENFDGGLKGIVAAERQARALAQGNRRVDRAADAKVRLTHTDVLATLGLTNIPMTDDGYVLLIGRRNASGFVDVVAAVPPHKPTLDMVLRQVLKRR